MSDPSDDSVHTKERSTLEKLFYNSQIQTALRNALLALSALLVGRGIITADTADLVRAILEIAAPAVVSVAVVVWSVWKGTKKELVKEVKAMPEIAGVVVKNWATGPLKTMADSDKPEDRKIITESMAVNSGGQSSGG